MKKTLSEKLRKMHACEDAVAFCEGKTLRQAWKTCRRADWMMWLLAKMIGKKGWPTHPEVVGLGAMCARRALRFVPEGEDRPRKSVEAAERFAEKPSMENWVAAIAAGDAAWAARAARDVAYSVRDAAWAVDWVARDAAGDAAGDAEDIAMCNEIRKRVPKVPEL